MRLFVAIELSDELRNHLVRVQDKVRTVAPNLSFTRPENLHLTLKFLGEVPDPDVPSLTDALNTVPPVGAFPLTTTGIICFPDRGRVRVISADVNAPDNLLQLQSHIETATEARGFARENRSYHPHITLARARTPLPPPMRQKLSDTGDAHGDAPSMPVNDFVLMQSRLLPKGAEYTPAARFYIKLP
jgi:2'-5' RNA ligase